MKTIRTYQKGCDWCGATGIVPTNNFGMGTSPITTTCPVCQGAKTIPVTETFEDELNPIKLEQ